MYYREKEDDLERRYQLLIGELRSIIAIEGMISKIRNSSSIKLN